MDVTHLGPHPMMFFLHGDNSEDCAVGACTEFGLTWLLNRKDGTESGCRDHWLRTLLHVYVMSFWKNLRIDQDGARCVFSPQLDAFYDFWEW